jgi:hypothetical protein
MPKFLSHYRHIWKVCEICKKEFPVFPYRVNAKFCSRKCQTKSKIGKHPSPQTEIKKGQRLSPETEFKGNDESYHSLHQWIYMRLGKAKKCSLCGTKNKKTKFEWSNKSGRYLREFDDWWSLCLRCHRNYDKERRKLKKSHPELFK